MPVLQLSDDQVVELVRQLPPDTKREMLLELAADAAPERGARAHYAEQQLRRLCAERGFEWDKMSEPEREAFIDDLVHEDRECER